MRVVYLQIEHFHFKIFHFDTPSFLFEKCLVETKKCLVSVPTSLASALTKLASILTRLVRMLARLRSVPSFHHHLAAVVNIDALGRGLTDALAAQRIPGSVAFALSVRLDAANAR